MVETNIPIIVVAGLAAYALLRLARFALADADLNLLSKGPHKRDAFTNKVIWVTGASQGFGRMLALYFDAQGAKLILSSRSKERLERVKAECSGTHAAAHLVLPFDLTGPAEELEAAAAQADTAFSAAGVDYLIQNAGNSQRSLASETSAHVAAKMMELNALGPMSLARALLPRLLQRRRGQLVVVASMAAKVPSPGQAVYSATKMALLGYFDTLACEVADRGITVTLVCPGPIAGGEASGPRLVWGPEGLIEAPDVGSSAKVSVRRAVRLTADAMAARLPEVWIARHPVLLCAYLMQYAPSLGRLLLRRVGPKRAAALSSGKSGYNFKSFLGSGGNKDE